MNQCHGNIRLLIGWLRGPLLSCYGAIGWTPMRWFQGSSNYWESGSHPLNVRMEDIGLVFERSVCIDFRHVYLTVYCHSLWKQRCINVLA
jgi:hypothetical protein